MCVLLLVLAAIVRSLCQAFSRTFIRLAGLLACWSGNKYTYMVSEYILAISLYDLGCSNRIHKTQLSTIILRTRISTSIRTHSDVRRNDQWKFASLLCQPSTILYYYLRWKLSLQTFMWLAAKRAYDSNAMFALFVLVATDLLIDRFSASAFRAATLTQKTYIHHHRISQCFRPAPQSRFCD